MRLAIYLISAACSLVVCRPFQTSSCYQNPESLIRRDLRYSVVPVDGSADTTSPLVLVETTVKTIISTKIMTTTHHAPTEIITITVTATPNAEPKCSSCQNSCTTYPDLSAQELLKSIGARRTELPSPTAAAIGTEASANVVFTYTIIPEQNKEDKEDLENPSHIQIPHLYSTNLTSIATQDLSSKTLTGSSVTASSARAHTYQSP